MAKLYRQVGREDGAINWKEGCIPLLFCVNDFTGSKRDFLSSLFGKRNIFVIKKPNCNQLDILFLHLLF
jgi:hypothetical protein